MSKHQHSYEFPLDPTLLDELSAWRDGTDGSPRPTIIAQCTGRLVHAARALGARLAGRTPTHGGPHDVGR